MTPPEFLAAVAEAFGPYAKSPDNPKGANSYYVEGAAKPYVVMFSENDEPCEFATAEEAVRKAQQLKVAQDSQPHL